MTDITIALETVRTAVEWSYQRRVRATLPALSTIEAELTRLREERDAWKVEALHHNDREQKVEAERDEAVAALRIIADWDGDVEAEDCPGLRGIAHDALARLSTPKQPETP